MVKGVGFLEKRPGEKSMMRLLALIATGIGGITVFWTMYLLTRVVIAVTSGVTSAVAIVGSLTLLVTAALGLILGGEGMKMLQQRGEAKELQNGPRGPEG